MATRLVTGAILAALAVFLPASPAVAQEPAPKPLAEVEITPEAIRWEPLQRYASLTLTIAGTGLDWTRTFEGGEPPTIKVKTKKGAMPDGTYGWELAASPEVSDETRERLAAARKAQERGEKVDLSELGLPEGPLTQSGSFSVRESRFVSPEEREPEPKSGDKATEIEGQLLVSGDLIVKGKKSFLAADPEAPGRSLIYVALEGPEAGTYLRGSAVTVDGEARIELPAHFAAVTEIDGLTVQLTPAGGWSPLYVVEKSPALLVVREAEGRDGIAFDYLIQGVRRGFADHRVEQPADEN